jgi:hypothetical protein
MLETTNIRLMQAFRENPEDCVTTGHGAVATCRSQAAVCTTSYTQQHNY